MGAGCDVWCFSENFNNFSLIFFSQLQKFKKGKKKENKIKPKKSQKPKKNADQNPRTIQKRQIRDLCFEKKKKAGWLGFGYICTSVAFLFCFDAPCEAPKCTFLFFPFSKKCWNFPKNTKIHTQHPTPSKIFILVIGIPTHSTKTYTRSASWGLICTRISGGGKLHFGASNPASQLRLFFLCFFLTPRVPLKEPPQRGLCLLELGPSLFVVVVALLIYPLCLAAYPALNRGGTGFSDVHLFHFALSRVVPY